MLTLLVAKGNQNLCASNYATLPTPPSTGHAKKAASQRGYVAPQAGSQFFKGRGVLWSLAFSHVHTLLLA